MLDLETNIQSYLYKDDLTLPEGIGIASYYKASTVSNSYNDIYTDGEKLFMVVQGWVKIAYMKSL